VRVLVALFCVNEHVKIERALKRFPRPLPGYDVVVMDDGSTDDSPARVRAFSDVKLLRHETNLGIGAAIRTVMRYAVEQGYDVIVHMAGNDKDDPLLIPRLLEPVEKEAADFVQGSRYLKEGGYAKMPLYRILATKYVHPLLFRFASGRAVTDSTNGFRAYKTSLLKDPRLDLDQPWLRQYELEPYMYAKVISLGYKVLEVPVTKIYPPKEEGYTKIKPVVGWWSILRPLVFLGLGIKK
jgi:dolichol-phosphate mannosyltransferase